MSYRESHLEKGQDYHDTFESIPHRKMLWRCERVVLHRIVGRFFKGVENDHLDFACGTGRILALLRPYHRRAMGVDVSEKMVSVARENVDAEFVVADVTTTDALGDQTFDLITAFRFFPNAEMPLRRQVFGILATHLNDDGYLVFNNHVNPNSLIRRLARLFGGGTSFGMTRQDVDVLTSAAGLRVVRSYPLGLLPLSERRMPAWLGWLWRVELLFSSFPGLSSFAHDTVYVCAKVGK